jgi:hypothetical protein
VQIGLAGLVGTICYGILLPFYPGNGLVLLAFVVSATLVGGCAALIRPSCFVVVAALFVTLGFTVKLVAHLTFGASLIEPVGRFAGTATQWDVALGYATAGHLGFAVAIVVAGRFPSRYPLLTHDVIPNRTQFRLLAASLVGLLVIATAVYTANQKYNILRIGYPSRIDLSVNAYLAASFVISWGALLGGLALTQWLVESGRLPSWSILVVAMFLGVAASVTMGSRIQYLLYVLAACAVLVARRDLIGSRRGVVVSLGAAAVLFVMSLAIVSLQRDAVFNDGDVQAPTSAPSSLGGPSTAGSTSTVANISTVGSPSPRSPSAGQGPAISRLVDVSQDDQRYARMLNEIRSLVVMRWVGLEGVMTTAGNRNGLDRDTLVFALTEDPATGTDGLYQRLSHSTYTESRGFTFLTLPGIIGVGSLSGSLSIIFAFVLMMILGLHTLEVLAAKLTGNVAVGAVCGVSLAYLTAQMGFPWTLLVFVVELAVAVAVLAVYWATLRHLASSRAD